MRAEQPLTQTKGHTMTNITVTKIDDKFVFAIGEHAPVTLSEADTEATRKAADKLMQINSDKLGDFYDGIVPTYSDPEPAAIVNLPGVFGVEDIATISATAYDAVKGLDEEHSLLAVLNRTRQHADEIVAEVNAKFGDA
jgi:hypothetical protein